MFQYLVSTGKKEKFFCVCVYAYFNYQFESNV